MRTLCIYHGKCADGFTAAWAVWKALGETVEFVPGVYGEAPPDCRGKDVILVDFSYKRPVLIEMRKTARSILVLDHHRTAEADLAAGDGFTDMRGWTGGVTWERHLRNAVQDGFENAHNTIYTLFDMERSGAQITWDYFHPDIWRPVLVEYVGDRDLWLFVLPHSRAVNAFIFAHEYTFNDWNMLEKRLRDHLVEVAAAGAAIEKKHHKDVAELVSVTRRRMVIGGLSVPVANIPYTLTSDAGHLMAKGEPFAACYWDTPAGRVFSLRSTDDGADVSAVAKTYGGGGHARASGFQRPLGWEGDPSLSPPQGEGSQ